MLGMAFFKSLVKHHGVTFFEPLGKALQAAGIKHPSPTNLRHALVLAPVAAPYARWWLAQVLRPKARVDLPSMPARLAVHAQFAANALQRQPREISAAMRKHRRPLTTRSTQGEEQNGY